MRKLRLCLVAGLSLIAGAPLAADVTVTKRGTALYIGAPDVGENLDKVWRLRIGDGAVDFVGERLIPSGTPQGRTIGAYQVSTHVLRNGSDEAPTIHAEGKFLGGNHKVDGRSTVTEYHLSVLAGDNLVAGDGQWTADKVTISETYGVTNGKVAVAQIANEYSFDASGLCYFRFTVTSLLPLNLEYFGGMQMLRPVVGAGQTLILIVPGSKLANGLNITNLTDDFFLTSDMWDRDTPALFEVVVNENGAPKATLVMGYNKRASDVSVPLFISKRGKLYPRGFEGKPGAFIEPDTPLTATGYFGALPGSNWNGEVIQDLLKQERS